MPKSKQLLGERFGARHHRTVSSDQQDAELAGADGQYGPRQDVAEQDRLLLPSVENRHARNLPLAGHQFLGRKQPGARTLNVAAILAASVIFTWIGFEAYTTGGGALMGTELQYWRGNYYDIHSAPRNVVRWIGERLLTDVECAHRNDTIIARCCASLCGGFGDRARGLGALLVMSESVGRKLCIAPDYFVSGPQPKCTDGTFIKIEEKSAKVFNLGSVTKPTAVPGNRTSALVISALRKTKYLTTGEPIKPPQLGDGSKDARQFGTLSQLSVTLRKTTSLNLVHSVNPEFTW